MGSDQAQVPPRPAQRALGPDGPHPIVRHYGAPLIFRPRAGDPKGRGTFEACDLAGFGYDWERHERESGASLWRDPRGALGDALGCDARP